MENKETNTISAKEYFLMQSIRKRKMQHHSQAAGNKETMNAILLDLLQETWLKIFFSVKYEFRTYSVDGNRLRTDDGKIIEEHKGERSRWDEFAYAIQNGEQTPHIAELHSYVKKYLLDAMTEYSPRRRWKLLLLLYLSADEIPMECLSSKEKLEETLLNVLYEETLDEVKHSHPVVLK